jgi:hypothetical protein
MSPLARLLRDGLDAAPRAAATLFVAFGFWAAALELGASRGFVPTLLSPLGFALVLAGGALLVAGGAGALLAPRPRARRLARAAALGGTGLAILALPLSLVLRDVRMQGVVEGATIGPRELPGLASLRLGEVTVLPRGPHVLSKTVDVRAEVAGAGQVVIGLFPPVEVGPWRMNVVRFGYAPTVNWEDAAGRRLASGRVLLGTVPHSEDEAALVTWLPDPNVMMGAGTFPPKTEELVAAPEGGHHLFVRLERARIAGVERDLTDPEAYRWMADGRAEDPRFLVQILRGREKVAEGRLAGGEELRYAGGTVRVGGDVALWVDLLATRDPWLRLGAAGLAIGLAGGLAMAVLAIARSPARRADM